MELNEGAYLARLQDADDMIRALHARGVSAEASE